MEEFMTEKDEGHKEAEEEEWTMQCYAAVFVLVASFQIWNRVCKMARYSPAREIRVFAVENVPRLGRRPKESVGRVWLI
jgi:hypothetical protein